MSKIRLVRAARAALVATLFSAGTHAQDANDQNARSPGISEHDVAAKAAYCKSCHGVDAQGYRGEYPMPRLAGQQPEYIQAQLKAFIESRRTNPVMSNVAHELSPAMVAALSTYFKDLDPAPLAGAPTTSLDEGEKIFTEGVPGANVPPCASCHGKHAKGDGIYPRLAGQLNDYIVRKLSNWDKERGQNPNNPDNSAIMEPVAHNLTPQQRAAVAAYVSHLK